MNSRRIATASGLAAALFLFDGIAAVMHGGDHGLASHALTDAGVGGVISVLFGLVFADQAVRQWGAADDAARKLLFNLSLGAIFWGFVRVGAGDAAIVPATVAATWLAFWVVMFAPITDDVPDDEEGTATEPPDPG